MKIYAMSDIHGHIDELNMALSLINMDQEDAILVLLGDYIHGHDSYAVLDRVMTLEKHYGSDRVIALMGNHEEAVDEGRSRIDEGDDVIRDVDPVPYLKWIHSLRKYYKTGRQIFVHAGIEEEAGDLWEHGTPFYEFFEKYPPQTGHFYMDIIAGHTGTSTISGDPEFHDIYFDGKSHYYIDGSVWKSGRIPVLIVDTDNDEYFEISPGEKKRIEPYGKWRKEGDDRS